MKIKNIYRSKMLGFLFASIALFAVCNDSQAYAADKLGIAIPYPIKRINPLFLQDPINHLILRNISVALTSLGPNGKSKLELAHSLRGDADGTSWVVSLRNDAVFPSLTPVYGKEVKESFVFLKGLLAESKKRGIRRAKLSSLPGLLENQTSDKKAAPAQRLAEELDSIEDIEVHQIEHGRYPFTETSTEIVFKLSRSNPDFSLTLSLFPIIDTTIAKSFGRELGLGTNSSFAGPYQIRENRLEQGVVIEKTPNFYRPGIPKTSVIEFRYFDEANDALRALRVGGVDIIAIPTPELIDDIKDDPTLASIPSPFVNMRKISGEWMLPKLYWSKEGNPKDRLSTVKIIIRKSLHLDSAAHSRFDLSGSFLP